MANTETHSIYWHVYNELVKAIKSSGIKNIYANNRSKKMDGVSEFVVISIPSALQNVFAGNEDTMLKTTGVFYLGEQAKTDNTPNLSAQTDLVQKIKALFPISDEHIEAVKPVVQFAGDDGSSFQMTMITFNLRTKFNSYLK